jgi:hypothetical protein
MEKKDIENQIIICKGEESAHAQRMEFHQMMLYKNMGAREILEGMRDRFFKEEETPKEEENAGKSE